MNEKQRTPYEESAAKDKKRYEEEKANYNVSLTVRINHAITAEISIAKKHGTKPYILQADAEEEESS